ASGSEEPESQSPIRRREGRREADEDAVAALWIWTWIALVVQSLAALKKRIVAEECVGEIALDEFSLRRVRRKVVDENSARFFGTKKIDRQLERAKIFWTIDQHRVAALQSCRQNFARVPVEKIDIRLGF